MANIDVYGVDFLKGQGTLFFGKLTLKTKAHRFIGETIHIEQIAYMEIVSAHTTKDTGASIGAGILGAAICGTPGFLAGVLMGNSKGKISFVARFKDGRILLATTDHKTYNTMFAAALSNMRIQHDCNLLTASTQNLPPVEPSTAATETQVHERHKCADEPAIDISEGETLKPQAPTKNKKTEGPNRGDKLMLGCLFTFGTFVLFILFGVIISTTTGPTKNKPHSGLKTTSVSQPSPVVAEPPAEMKQAKTETEPSPPAQPPVETPPPDPFTQMSSADHLKAAKEALNDNYKPQKDITKTTWGRVDDAKEHLAAIGKDAKEYREAQKLMKEVDRRNREIEKASKIAIGRFLAQQRSNVADALERDFLSKGLDITIKLSGKENTVMTLKYVLFSRPLIYQITNDTDFLQRMKNVGFTKVVFDDIYNNTWTYNLTK